MPRLSDTMTEGTIARWLKHSGDTVEKGDILLEIETDKATMELEAYESGVLEKILVDEGKTVPIGEPIGMIGDGSGGGEETGDRRQETGGEGAQAASAQAAPAEAPVEAPEAPGQSSAQPATPSHGEGEGAPAAPQRSFGYGFPEHDEVPAPGGGASAPPSSQATQAPPSGQAAQAPSPVESNGEVKASPMARRIAREHGLDLASIQGSGPGGRVIRDDVERAAAQGTGDRGQGTGVAAPAPAAPAQAPAQQAAPAAQPAPARAVPGPVAQGGPDQEVEEVPLNNVKRITGARMVESLQSAPHFFLTSVFDVTDLLALRQQVNGQLGDKDAKISVNDLIVKACALALRAVPQANASFGGDKILLKKRIHVGVAVSTERGLTVPVIRDADQKSVGQIARDSHALIERARAGRLTPAEFTGGTFTVSNLGMFGIEHFTAVINPPEAAILAVGMSTKEPVVLKGQVEVRDRMRVTLSVDHRVLDGADGARYLQALKGLIESPMRMLVQ
jgi:pyruvate dehydrogenase E2 component (dihydrolipoamide acetyltransferase)